MDFVERWLGISPDGGSGMFEVLLLSVLLGIAAAQAYRRARGRTPR